MQQVNFLIILYVKKIGIKYKIKNEKVNEELRPTFHLGFKTIGQTGFSSLGRQSF